MLQSQNACFFRNLKCKKEYEVSRNDLVLLLKKIAVGMAVAGAPLIIIVSVLWLTRTILEALP